MNRDEPPAAASLGLLAEVHRGENVESRHYGALALVEGDRQWSLGDVERPVFARSAVKPFQSLPLLERGIADRLELGDAELAVLGASHNGTAAHLRAVRSLLARGGLSEEHLGCGPHAPFDRDARQELDRSGAEPQPVHNNCSGKHAGFLLLSQDLGAPLDAYLDPASPGQLAVRRAVLEMTQVEEAEVTLAIDGCAAPTYRLPLIALARGFQRLMNPSGLPSVRQRACRRLHRAIQAEPLLFAGKGRFCTSLLHSAKGMIYPKNGAEGVYACGLQIGERSFGLAVKVIDGNERGYFPVVVEVLAGLGLWPEIPKALAGFARVSIRNTKDQLVGEVCSALNFPDRW